MASTPEGRRLTEAHRLAQQQVRDDFLAEFIALWALLDSARLDETGPGWIQAVTRAVRGFRRESAAVATQYFWEFDAVEAPSSTPQPRVDWAEAEQGTSRPGGPVSPPSAPNTGRPPRRTNGVRRQRTSRDLDRVLERSGIRFDLDEPASRPRGERRTRIEFEVPELDEDRHDRATEVSLIVTGPVGQKSKRGRGKTEQVARDESFVEASGAASRQVLTGGRQSLLRLIDEDTRLLGYIRVSDGDPCAFCAMLISRGPVYRTPNRASFQAHDHCACTAEPVYTTDTLWPGRAREFQKLWNEHIRNRHSGADARREWRRLYERLQREQRRQQIA